MKLTQLSTIKTNIIANYFGTFWSVFSLYFFIPFYIKYLGAEAYGLIMFSVTLQAIISLLDSGFSPSLRRELSWGNRYTDSFVSRSLSLIKTVEFFYLCIFIVLFFIFFTISDWIANNWFHLKSLQVIDVKWAIVFMAANAVLQMQSSLYNGSFLALELQVFSNILQFFFSLFRNGFVILILILNPTPIAFLIWQFLVILIYIGIQRYFLFKTIHSFSENKEIYGTKDLLLLKDIWKLSSMFLIISILSTINLQTDKLVISKLLPIANLGYYNTAYSISIILVSLSAPISTALSPLLIKAYSLKDTAKTYAYFHKYAKFISILTGALGITILLFSYKIISIWTGNEYFTSQAAPVAPYMIISALFLAAQIIPFNIAIASADMKPIIFTCVVNIILTIPAYIFATKKFGIEGAGFVWLISNFFMMLFNIYFYLRKTLSESYVKWLIHDFMIPILIVGSTAALLSLFKPNFTNNFLELISIGFVFGISIFTGLLIFFMPEFRVYFNRK